MNTSEDGRLAKTYRVEMIIYWLKFIVLLVSFYGVEKLPSPLLVPVLWQQNLCTGNTATHTHKYFS
jgi:hypothetical protein